MRRWLWIFLLALPATARQEQESLDGVLQRVDEAEMKKVLTEIADDKYEGRRTGSPGIKKAREYIVSELKAWGVKPTPGGYELPWMPCANIGAISEGSDPKLKGEYIILGSHYDHLGRMRKAVDNDDIANGADDNASGSTLNLFVAKVLAASKFRLKRSVLHLWFSGEEQGMNGSKSYCQKPTIPLSQTVAMLNCDMVGRPGEEGANLYGMGTSLQFGPAGKRALELAPKAKVNLLEAKGPYFHRSDQNIFWSRGIPAMFLFGTMHGDYHRVTDHADRIEFPKLADLTKFMLALVVELANHDGKIERNPSYK